MSTTDRPERLRGARPEVDLADLGTVGEAELQSARSDAGLQAVRLAAAEALAALERDGRFVLRQLPSGYHSREGWPARGLSRTGWKPRSRHIVAVCSS